ncbi:MAG TPA: type II toxin-antitoxin system HicB family antitoxin [bacterium]|nr:type II toxin-antitoxin system HicB family antitoxin [bacterium]
MKYVEIVEKGETGYGAYVPDLPGCIAAAESRDEVLHLIKEAIEFHIEGLQTAGESVLAPASVREVVEVNAA